MSSSTSSSDPDAAPWRRFLRLAVTTAAVSALIVYLFVVLVDPYDTLPLSLPIERTPVASNARFAFPALARAQRFDSALFGTSTSRLLRPQALDPLFEARFANLAMNDATGWEQARLMEVFNQAHPHARMVMVGLDVAWCNPTDRYPRTTPRPFPEWLYRGGRWRGYVETFSLYSIETSGQLFGIMIGVTRPFYGRNGYTSFVPDDSRYDPARVAAGLRAEGPRVAGPALPGDPAAWPFSTIGLLRSALAQLPDSTRKLLYFVPYNRVLLPPPGHPAEVAWLECKRRIGELASAMQNTVAVDFMIPSPITLNDDNYWDSLHYRVSVAEQIAVDLAKADRGEAAADYQILGPKRP